MKKVFRTIALTLAMAMMLGITAMAAPKVEAEDGKEVTAVMNSGNQKLDTLTYEDDAITDGGQYMIFVVKPESGAYIPTASSILYINQKQAAEDGEITFENIFPKSMTSSGILISGTGLTAPELIAKILAALLGDVDGSGVFNVGDVTQLLKCFAGLAPGFEIDEAAADADGSGAVNVGDATFLLKVLAGLESLN